MLKAALALLDCAVFAVVIVVKRIQFFFFPEHKEEVMQQQSDLIMTDERAKFFRLGQASSGPVHVHLEAASGHVKIVSSNLISLIVTRTGSLTFISQV